MKTIRSFFTSNKKKLKSGKTILYIDNHDKITGVFLFHSLVKDGVLVERNYGLCETPYTVTFTVCFDEKPTVLKIMEREEITSIFARLKKLAEEFESGKPSSPKLRASSATPDFIVTLLNEVSCFDNLFNYQLYFPD